MINEDKIGSAPVIRKENKNFNAEISVSCPTIVKSKNYPIDILVVERIALFKEKMLVKCKKDLVSSFNAHIEKIIRLIESNEKNFRGVK